MWLYQSPSTYDSTIAFATLPLALKIYSTLASAFSRILKTIV